MTVKKKSDIILRSVYIKRDLPAGYYVKCERLQLLYFESVKMKTAREICHAVRKLQAQTA